MMLNMPKERHQVKYVKLSLLFWLLSNLSIYYFRCYCRLFLPLYLSFYLKSLHRHPDSPHLLYFHPHFPHSHADSPHLHSHPIPCIPTLILRISLIPFSNSPFWLLQIACSVCIFLRIYFRKIDALVQKRTLPFFTTA